jgi:NaMN:DMB phosphoribosyltransferase
MVHRLRNPVTVAEVLVPALCRQLAAHGVSATPEQVAAIAANVAYSIAEAAR